MLTDKRYKQLMINVGLPNSRSLFLALQQCAIESSIDEQNRILNKFKELKSFYLDQDRSDQEKAFLVAAVDDCISLIKS